MVWLYNKYVKKPKKHTFISYQTKMRKIILNISVVTPEKFQQWEGKEVASIFVSYLILRLRLRSLPKCRAAKYLQVAGKCYWQLTRQSITVYKSRTNGIIEIIDIVL